MKRVDQQDNCAADAEGPEGWRDDAFLFPLTTKPLRDEPAGEEELSRQTEGYPDLFARHVLRPGGQRQEVDYAA